MPLPDDLAFGRPRNAAAPKPGVVTADGVLDAAGCRRLIRFAEDRGFAEATVRDDAANPAGGVMMKRIRDNDRVTVDDDACAARLWAALRPLAARFDQPDRAAGLNGRLRFYRYGPTQRFKRHRDQEERVGGRVSRVTVLLYLSDGFGGGETLFHERTYAGGVGTDHKVAVRPRAGSVLLFRHPLWHEGVAVTAGRKYVLRTDVMYAAG